MNHQLIQIRGKGHRPHLLMEGFAPFQEKKKKKERQKPTFQCHFKYKRSPFLDEPITMPQNNTKWLILPNILYSD